MHTSNLYQITLQETPRDSDSPKLAGMDRVFLCNSGAEANEAAIKIARLYGHGRDINKPHVIAMEGSFHGRTMATLDRHRQSQGSGGLRTAAQRFRARAVQRRARDRDHRGKQRRGRRDSRRADHRRRRRRGSRRRLSAGAAPHLRREGLAVDARRSADRQRPHRPLFRLPAPTASCPMSSRRRKDWPTDCRSARVLRAESRRKRSSRAITVRRSAAIRSHAPPRTRCSMRWSTIG